jgi:hypothetical protein
MSIASPVINPRIGRQIRAGHYSIYPPPSWCGGTAVVNAKGAQSSKRQQTPACSSPSTSTCEPAKPLIS